MFRFFIFYFLMIASLWSVTLKEAILRASSYNPLILEQKEKLQASIATTKATKSTFLPKFDLRYNYNTFSAPSYVGDSSSSAVKAIISYNLFNGFKDLQLIKSANAQQISQMHLLTAAKEDLKLRVSLAFINYQRTSNEINVAKDAMLLLKRQYKDAKNFYRQGILAKNSYLQVNVELLTAKQSLLTANRNIKIARLVLNKEMGGTLKNYEKIEALKIKGININYTILEKKMYKNRSELKYALAQKASLDYQYKAVGSQYFPTINIQAQYQLAGTDIFPNGGTSSLRNRERSFGINMNWNLYQGGKTEQDQYHFLSLRNAYLANIKNIRLQLALQFSKSIETYKLSKNQILVAKIALRQAKENYRIVNSQFRSNIANTTLLLEAQKLLTRAKVNYYKAFFASYDAVVQIERIVQEDI